MILTNFFLEGNTIIELISARFSLLWLQMNCLYCCYMHVFPHFFPLVLGHIQSCLVGVIFVCFLLPSSSCSRSIAKHCSLDGPCNSLDFTCAICGSFGFMCTICGSFGFMSTICRLNQSDDWYFAMVTFVFGSTLPQLLRMYLLHLHFSFWCKLYTSRHSQYYSIIFTRMCKKWYKFSSLKQHTPAFIVGMLYDSFIWQGAVVIEFVRTTWEQLMSTCENV